MKVTLDPCRYNVELGDINNQIGITYLKLLHTQGFIFLKLLSKYNEN